jgi:hypothetical protein
LPGSRKRKIPKSYFVFFQYWSILLQGQFFQPITHLFCGEKKHCVSEISKLKRPWHEKLVLFEQSGVAVIKKFVLLQGKDENRMKTLSELEDF